MPPELTTHAGPQGRYVIGDEIAAGGMATVHLGRMLGDAGFARTVAIKRLHPQYAKDPDFASMLLDEGRLASRIQHLNVVPTLDVVASHGDLFMVMEYVHGEPLNGLLRTVVRRKEKIPPRIVAAVLSGALRGLHAAHEARDERGRVLGVVHRDVSPQNIIVGTDGVARVLDFGIAKAAGRAHATQTGQIKGKFAYMPPEQLHGEELDRRADIYAAGVVLWESLAGARLFLGTDQTPNIAQLLAPRVEPPSARVPGLATAYDVVTMRALSPAPAGRFPTALEMAEALEACGPVAPPAEVGAWVEATAGEALAERARRIAAIEGELARKIRDSVDMLDTIEETITDIMDLPLPPLPAAWLRQAVPPPAPSQPEPAATVAEPAPSAPSRPTAEGPSAAPSRPAAAVPSAAPSRPAAAVPSAAPTKRSPRVRPDALPELELENTRPSMTARKLPVALWGAAAAALVAVVILATVGAEPAHPGPAASASAMPAESASAPPAESAPPPAPATASASAQDATAGSAPSADRAPVSTGAPHRPPPRPRAPDAACSPPFTIDAAGHKHYKRECLR
jgi:serine/threonine protein kinase